MVDSHIAVGFAALKAVKLLQLRRDDNALSSESRRRYFDVQRSAGQFPLGVFGIDMATAVFSPLSTHAVREDWNNFSMAFNKAIKFVLFIGIPASRF